ncbi:MAG: hypothetical protein AUH43_20100 [Acidobacteria bacterium 13_1_40CM_65_14]|nr:MAG: hypothetical protein AUH43_20100 [Acidobacteria bacterium 13_1_40CM_65_14]
MTPTIVWLTPPRTSVRPTAEGSPPKRVRQNASLSTTSRGPPNTSSCGLGARPIAGATPSTEKNRGEMRIASTRSGSAPVVSVMFSK